MGGNGKLLEMLTGYAAAHQNPFNVFVHMVGIPTIMLGALIPLSRAGFEAGGVAINLAHLAVIGFFVFYLTLDRVFAVGFLVVALLIAQAATYLGTLPRATAGTIAALAAPFFVVVELFKVTGLRDDLFNTVQAEIEQRRAREA